MPSYEWKRGIDPGRQLELLLPAIGTPGYLVVAFEDGAGGEPAPPPALELWIRSRAVTVADVGGVLRGGALEVAACCDLVFVRDGAALELPQAAEPPSRFLLWALARAGRAALASGLLDGEAMTARRAVELGVAQGLADPGSDLPLPARLSVAALTAARDLMRSRAAGGAGRALELATFRLLFATGDPEEGARAFLERREAEFPAGGNHGRAGGHGG